MINTYTGIGRLTRDVEHKQTKSGTDVFTFSLAIDQSYKKDGNKIDKVSFFNFTAWGKVGEIISQYTKQGQLLAVTAEPEQRTWETQDGTKRTAIDFKVTGFQFLGSKNETNQSAKQDEQPSFDIKDNPFADDDIPF